MHVYTQAHTSLNTNLHWGLCTGSARAFPFPANFASVFLEVFILPAVIARPDGGIRARPDDIPRPGVVHRNCGRNSDEMVTKRADVSSSAAAPLDLRSPLLCACLCTGPH